MLMESIILSKELQAHVVFGNFRPKSTTEVGEQVVSAAPMFKACPLNKKVSANLSICCPYEYCNSFLNKLLHILSFFPLDSGGSFNATPAKENTTYA